MTIISHQSMYLYKSLIQTMRFFLPILFLAACTGAPKDDGTSLPPPLYQQPQTIPANPKGGYAINPVTGDSIQPIINSLGHTLITGLPIPLAIGITQSKSIHPDSVAKPKVVKDRTLSSLKKYDAQRNRFKVPENLPTFPVDQSKLTKIFIPQISKGDTTHYMLNSVGQKISTGVPILAKGNIVPLKHPQPTQALPLVKKDAAIANIQYMDLRQGMASYVVWSIIEDRKGNLWFGNEARGVSKYDGQFFTHFTEKEGLSNDRVVSVFEDKKGNLWFGTDRGVNKYDGASFTHFTEKNGFCNYRVESIMEDRNGNLWFGSFGGGISKYDGKSFTHFTEKEGLSSNRVNSIFEDKKGNLWLGTDQGVNKYDGHSFTHFTEKEGLSNNSVVSILEDKNEHLWFGTVGGGVNKYDGKSFTHFTEKEGLSNNTIRSIVEDKSGNLWFGTVGGGVNKYDGQFFTHFTVKEGLSINAVRSILEDKSGNLWIGTIGGGVNKYDGKSFTIFTEKEGLTNNLVRSIFVDKEGNLWFGTNDGVSKYDGQHFTEKEDLNKKVFLSILDDKNGNLWFCTLNDGVSKYDGKSLTHFTEQEGLSNLRVYTALEDIKGKLWFGTEGGVSKYDGQFFTHFTEKEGLSYNSVRAIVEDKKGNLWFGTFGGGVSKYDGHSFTHFTEKEGLSNNNIWSILEDKNGNLWFGTDGGGVNKYDGKSFTHFTQKEGLSNNIVRSILEDKEGNLWFGTYDGGANKYDGKSFTYFSEKEGLNNYITSIVEDKNQNLWFGTYGGGVSMMEKDAFQSSSQPLVVHLRQLYINETLPDYRNSSNNSIQKIKFDSVQAFENYPIYPRIPSDQNHLSFQYSAIDWSAPAKIKYSFRLLGLDNNWSIPSSKTLADYRNLPDGKFTFQVSAIGESGKWSKPFEYPFTILPPLWKTWWAYTLYALLFFSALRAFSLRRERRLREEKDQLQNKVEERTIELKKSLEELKSTQAQLIQSEKMASLGELTAGIAHEIQNPLNFVNNFSELNNELVTEIKDEIKIINDKIGESAITLNVQSSMLNVQELTDAIKDNSEKINQHGQRASSIVKGMLEHSRKSSGEKTLTDINAMCDEYLRLSYHGLRAKHKDFNADFKTYLDPNMPKINVVSQDIARVLLNIMNNAFQACAENLVVPISIGMSVIPLKDQRGLSESQNEYKPIVSVRTKYLGDKIEISITDNGPGIPDSIKDKIFQPFFTTKPTGQGTGLGLSLAYDIIKAHGGEITVESKNGNGTEFIIKIPITL
ncbi:MAG: hypothetical protein KA143_07930 [Saprospiraceae bacterium]|nr:hypothetical protein [Saprospiraceae bacterium]